MSLVKLEKYELTEQIEVFKDVIDTKCTWNSSTRDERSK